MTTTTTNQQMHAVLGTGPAGTTLALELANRGHHVVSVDRRGNGPQHPNIERRQADLADPVAAIAATAGADVIYHAVNVAYHLQVELLPGITTAILAAAEAQQAKLVVLDTLYPYGDADGDAITEETPWAATTRKGLLRAELDRRYLAAHAEGRIRTVMGRSADFFGPGVLNSALGGAVFPAALTGRPVLGMGDITLVHSYSFLPDVARALATLGETDRGEGRIWHLPTVPAVSTAAIHKILGELIGQPITAEILEKPVAHGPFDAQFMAEYAEMFYQNVTPQNMVSAAFEREFNLYPTPLRDALGETIAWYRDFLANVRM